VNGILEWGLNVVRGVQSFFGPGLEGTMKTISFVGSEVFAIAVLPYVYWCIDRRKGARIGLVVLLSAFANFWLKYLFVQPRPYDFDPSVGMLTEPTPGLPSGHSQSSVTFWGAMMTVLPKPWGVIALVLVPLLVGLSRVYLGVHFPTDVFAGWALGAVILALYFGLGPRLEKILHGFDMRKRVLSAAVVALAMVWLMPEDTAISGAFLGAGVGFGFASKLVRFDAGGPAGKKALRYGLGIVGALVLYLGPKYLIGDAFVSQAALIRFLRYALLGLWVAFGAPWCFLKLGLLDLEVEVAGEPEVSSELV